MARKKGKAKRSDPPDIPEHRPGERAEWKGKLVEIRAVGLDFALVKLPSGHEEWVERVDLTIVSPRYGA